MQITYLFEWWNIIFLLPLFAALIYILLMGPVDSDVGDADVDIHAEANAETHAEGVSHDHSFMFKMLSVFGVGRVPFSIIILCFCVLWSFFGFMSNYFLLKNGINPNYFWWVSILIALACSLMLLRWLSNVVAKFFPTYENFGVSAKDFLGEKAIVRFTVDLDSGSVTLYDKNGNFQELQCRAKEPIQKGTEVIILRYSQEQKVYVVAPYAELEVKA